MECVIDWLVRSLYIRYKGISAIPKWRTGGRVNNQKCQTEVESEREDREGEEGEWGGPGGRLRTFGAFSVGGTLSPG